jgi:Ca2+-binding RTX toxin-like protein
VTLAESAPALGDAAAAYTETLSLVAAPALDLAAAPTLGLAAPTLGLAAPSLDSPLAATLAAPPPTEAPPPSTSAPTGGGDRNEFRPIAGNSTSSPDVLIGTEGADILTGGAAQSTIAGFGGNDLLDGGDGDDTLAGGAGRDILLGGAGNDLLDGGDNADILAPGSGADVVVGGAGSDVMIFSDVPLSLVLTFNPDDEVGAITTIPGGTVLPAGTIAAPIVVDFAAGTVIQAGVVTTFTGVEGVLGTVLSDVFHDAGVGHAIDGGAGNDTIFGVAGTTLAYVTATGGVLADLARGVVEGNSSVGNDTVFNVTRIETTNFADTILGASAGEHLVGLGGNDTINGAGGNDTIEGGAGADSLAGGEGDDILVGGLGSDSLMGGGDSVFFASQGDVVTSGGQDIFKYFGPTDGGNVALNVVRGGIFGDIIKDFVSGRDTIAVEKGGFGGTSLGSLGPLSNGVNFSVIAAAFDGTNADVNITNINFSNGDPTFVFSTADNTLYCDDNGIGAGYTVIATLTNGAALAASDVEIFAG